MRFSQIYIVISGATKRVYLGPEIPPPFGNSKYFIHFIIIILDFVRRYVYGMYRYVCICSVRNELVYNGISFYTSVNKHFYLG